MRLLINIIFILFITRSPWTSVLLCWPPKVLQKCLFWQVLYIMAVDAVLRIQADNLRIFPTKLLFCIFGNFIFGLFPDVVQKIFNSQWLRSLMVLRRLVLLAVVLHLFLERSQLLSFWLYRAFGATWKFRISPFFWSIVLTSATYGGQKHALSDDPCFDLLKSNFLYIFRQWSLMVFLHNYPVY